MDERAKNQETANLLQTRRIERIEEPTSEPFVCVYSTSEDIKNGLFSYCYLLPIQHTEGFLENLGWSQRCDDFTPHVQSSERWSEGRTVREVCYLRDGNENGAQALVRIRDYGGLKPAHIEIAEEFRLFHNLYDDSANRVLVHCDINGVEHEVVRIRETGVQVQLRFLVDFLRAKQMHLAMQWDGGHWSKHSLADLGLTPATDDKRGPTFHWERVTEDSRAIHVDKSRSRLIGKAVILCPGPVQYVNPCKDEKEHRSFIIGHDTTGQSITHTSDPTVVNGDSGLSLQPVFFRRGVLAKYFADPAKYSVEDGYLRCGSLWGLSMDNDHPKYVIVFLKHLGDSLPASEHEHWRAFNVSPDGPVSETFFTRNIRAWFADPKMPDLRLKHLYRRVNSAWEEKYGWPLWREPVDQDRYVFSQAHLCLEENQAEFDQQNGLLAKLLNDFVNEEKVKAALQIAPVNPGSLNRLQQFLLEAGHADADRRILPLRIIQDLRSKGSAHRKSGDYEGAIKQAGLSGLSLVQASTQVFGGAVHFLEWILSDVLAIPLRQSR